RHRLSVGGKISSRTGGGNCPTVGARGAARDRTGRSSSLTRQRHSSRTGSALHRSPDAWAGLRREARRRIRRDSISREFACGVLHSWQPERRDPMLPRCLKIEQPPVPRCSCVFPFLEITVLQHPAVSRPRDADAEQLAVNGALHFPGHRRSKNATTVMVVVLTQRRWQLGSQRRRNRQAIPYLQIARDLRPELVTP